jgi:hypothetical protein
LDPETGRLSFVPIQGGDSFDSATCSPWEDDQGQSDMVGRWLGRSQVDKICEGCGLARYKFPSGQLLERVKLDVMPVSRPCFDPDWPTSVLFAAGDGKLYRYTFEGAPNAAQGSAAGEAGPTPLTWKTSTAGTMPVAISDPIWPSDSRFKGRLIASLTFLVKGSDGRTTMRSRLGWLRLNREGTEIVQTGHLIEQDRATSPGGDGPDETVPTLQVTEDGTGLMLAYLSHAPRELGWTLWAAPLKLDCESGTPTVDKSRLCAVAANRSHMIPVFSADGRTLYSIANSDPKPETIDRVSVPELVRHPADSMAGRLGGTGRLVKN